MNGRDILDRFLGVEEKVPPSAELVPPDIHCPVEKFVAGQRDIYRVQASVDRGQHNALVFEYDLDKGVIQHLHGVIPCRAACGCRLGECLDKPLTTCRLVQKDSFVINCVCDCCIRPEIVLFDCQLMESRRVKENKP